MAVPPSAVNAPPDIHVRDIGLEGQHGVVGGAGHEARQRESAGAADGRQMAARLSARQGEVAAGKDGRGAGDTGGARGSVNTASARTAASAPGFHDASPRVARSNAASRSRAWPATFVNVPPT